MEIVSIILKIVLIVFTVVAVIGAIQVFKHPKSEHRTRH